MLITAPVKTRHA